MMMSRSATKAARMVLPRYFSTAVARGCTAGGASSLRNSLRGDAASFFVGAPRSAENEVEKWVRFPILGSRSASTVALGEKKEEEEKVSDESDGSSAASGGDGKDNKGVVSYWRARSDHLDEEIRRCCWHKSRRRL